MTQKILFNRDWFFCLDPDCGECLPDRPVWRLSAASGRLPFSSCLEAALILTGFSLEKE